MSDWGQKLSKSNCKGGSGVSDGAVVVMETTDLQHPHYSFQRRRYEEIFQCVSLICFARINPTHEAGQ